VARRAAKQGHETVGVAPLGWPWRLEEALIGHRGGDPLTKLGPRACTTTVTTAFSSVRNEADLIQRLTPGRAYDMKVSGRASLSAGEVARKATQYQGIRADLTDTHWLIKALRASITTGWSCVLA
jgi:hypothetical protein